MIHSKCFTKDWILTKKQELAAADPGLLEKSIHALALLGHLVDSGLPFVFKGGTSLLLHLERIRRLSIDIDIFCGAPVAQLDAAAAAIAKLPPFTGFEESQRGARGLPNRRHFKFFYVSPLSGLQQHILLDVVEEASCPVPTERKRIRTSFIEVEREVWVTVPTIESLLGDKLTAFAPRTTGVPFAPASGAACDTMQVVKQLFDVAELFDVAQSFAAVAAAYDAMLVLEVGYRGGGFTRQQVLLDTREACLALSLHGLKGVPAHPDAALLVAGISRLGNHLVQGRYSLDDAKVSASKVALLTTLLLAGKPGTGWAARHFANTAETLAALRGLSMALPAWARLERIKAIRPEAFFHWQRASALQKALDEPDAS